MPIAGIPIGDTATGIVLQSTDLQHKFFRQQEVVAVEILDEFSSCYSPPGLTRQTWSRVMLMHDMDFFGVLGSKRIRNIRRIVRRTVIDDNDLDGAIGLPNHARYRLSQKIGPVMNRDDRAHKACDCDSAHCAARYLLDQRLNNNTSQARLLKMLIARVKR